MTAPKSILASSKKLNFQGSNFLSDIYMNTHLVFFFLLLQNFYLADLTILIFIAKMQIYLCPTFGKKLATKLDTSA